MLTVAGLRTVMDQTVWNIKVYYDPTHYVYKEKEIATTRDDKTTGGGKLYVIKLNASGWSTGEDS